MIKTKEKRTSALHVQVGGNHYKEFAIQPVEFINANKLSYLQGCVIKYICRYPLKGQDIQDLLKIKHYVDLILDQEYAASPTGESK